MGDQPQSLLPHFAVLKLNVNAEMSQSKYQDPSKYQDAYQSQKPTVSQPPKLLQDPQLVMMNQDKSATQSQDKFHTKSQLKNVSKFQNNFARKFHTSMPDKYARLLTMDITDTAMDMVTERDMDTIKLTQTKDNFF